jgi:uncharacterized NAD-dependent epimerase/dehydratase family protein
MVHLTAEHRVAILLHQGIRSRGGKTGLTFLRYSPTPVVAVIDQDCAGESLSQLTGIPREIPIVSSLHEAIAYQPNVLLIGIAPSGGALPEPWWQEVKQAVEAGLSLVNGLHTPMADLFEHIAPSQWIWDIRQEPKNLTIGKGKARSLPCQRILTVGTDMAVGKMSTSLELHRAALKRGIKSKFLATGQGGVMIAGEGIALDAIRVDFAAGAVERMVMDAAYQQDLLIVEGQGSLLHPGSTATLPLLRGTQPTGLILVHRAKQDHLQDLPEMKIPPLTEVVHLYETVASASGTCAPVKVKAIALNTFHLDLAVAQKEIARVREETKLPCTDVVRFGGEDLVNALSI